MRRVPRLAVIDLGSNSFRLVVFTAADGWWKRTDEIYLAVRIGEVPDSRVIARRLYAIPSRVAVVGPEEGGDDPDVVGQSQLHIGYEGDAVAQHQPVEAIDDHRLERDDVERGLVRGKLRQRRTERQSRQAA